MNSFSLTPICGVSLHRWLLLLRELAHSLFNTSEKFNYLRLQVRLSLRHVTISATSPGLHRLKNPKRPSLFKVLHLSLLTLNPVTFLDYKMHYTCPYCRDEIEYDSQNSKGAYLHMPVCHRANRDFFKTATFFKTTTAKQINRGYKTTKQRKKVVDASPPMPSFNPLPSDPAKRKRVTIAKGFDMPPVTKKRVIPAVPDFAKVPATSCLMCRRNLAGQSEVQALNHRNVCFFACSDKSCPVCKMRLPDSPESLLHLQKCQLGTADQYNSIERDDFVALYARMVGRVEVAIHHFKPNMGPCRNKRKIRQKLQEKRDSIDFRYACGESPLRTSVSQDGEEIDGWRTVGCVGKAARNLFPVVEEEPFEDLPIVLGCVSPVA